MHAAARIRHVCRRWPLVFWEIHVMRIEENTYTEEVLSRPHDCGQQG